MNEYNKNGEAHGYWEERKLDSIWCGQYENGDKHGKWLYYRKDEINHIIRFNFGFPCDLIIYNNNVIRYFHNYPGKIDIHQEEYE